MSNKRTANIPYGEHDPFTQFDIYYPENNPASPLICFVHGGAWISGDKQQHESLAQRLVAATNYPVAVPNYRPTPPSNSDPSLRHPMHVRDLIAFLLFIIKWENPPCSYDPSILILIGHSCSAHMISSLFFVPSASYTVPCPRILDSVKAVVLSEGIYDVPSLLRSFPKYREWFIESVFGSDPESESESSILNATLHHRVEFPWLLIHSEGDTLVDVYQTTEMHNHLKISQAGVLISLFDVFAEHDAILETEEYINLVTKFLLPSRSNI